MATIHSLSIKNFRGIKSLSHVFDKNNFVCLIGRGDSGKSTILEAISYVLSPSWNITFHDSDFYSCSTENHIEIEATLKDIPDELLKESKFGFYIRGLDTTSNLVSDEIEDTHEKVITIRLSVKRDLEPEWVVVNGRHSESMLISAYDRARLNVFIISDYVDRHFSWSKGMPLYSLLKQEETEEEENNIIIEAMREAKAKIDDHSFTQFDSVVAKVKASAQQLGIDISKTKTGIDFKDISIKDGRICLHEESVPFRLKGKGSKRLISTAIQVALADVGGIVLIDEIEQGLEPDRVQHLVSTLKKNNKGQVFITTHSRDVLVELEASDLFLIKKDSSSLIGFDQSLQGCLRKNPESFFAKKVVINEGATEIGICRSLNKYRAKTGKANAAFLGVRFADGTGSELVNYTTGFQTSTFPVCLFCDSDREDINSKKEGLKLKGIKIIDWEKGDSIEVAIFKYLPFKAAKEALNLAADLEHQDDPSQTIEQIKKGLWESIQQKYGNNCPTELAEQNYTLVLQVAIGKAANKGSWFKKQHKAEALGDVIFKYFDQLPVDNKLKLQLSDLSNWIDNNGL